MAGLLWLLLIGFVAGTIARLLMPGPNTPRGFIVTTLLGVAGAFLATAVGDATGIYRPHQAAGFIGAAVGSLVILYLWHRLIAAGIIRDHGLPREQVPTDPPA
jgi:uncharacterized membrane protein YeaQ/YmgE (transglycosylase-associated protein family)